MIAWIVAMGLGVATMGLGVKAFTPAGIPLTQNKNLTGGPAKVLGVLCFVLGLGFFGLGLFALVTGK